MVELVANLMKLHSTYVMFYMLNDTKQKSYYGFYYKCFCKNA